MTHTQEGKITQPEPQHNSGHTVKSTHTLTMTISTCKVLDGRPTIVNRDLEKNFKPQIELLEIKMTMSEMKNTFNEIDRTLQKQNKTKKNSKPEDIVTETT